MQETIIKTLFGIMFGLFFVGQIVNASRAHFRAGPIEYREKHHVAMQIFRKGIGIPWLAAILAYFVKPAWVSWAAIPFPLWLRWAGIGLGLISLPLLWWTELALDKNFNTTLHVREAHTLVTWGPYRYVRHPMYTAHMLLVTALLLAPANYLIGLPGMIGLIVILINRIKREEQTMIELFGEQYLAYMDRTGRFLPRIRRA